MKASILQPKIIYARNISTLEGVGLVFRYEAEIIRSRAQESFPFSHIRWVLVPVHLFFRYLRQLDPVRRLGARHQSFQIVAADIGGSPFIDLLRIYFQKANRNVSKRNDTHDYQPVLILRSIYLYKKDCHSQRNRLVVLTPWLSDPQCSKPKSQKLFIISNRSREEMSQWRWFLISSKSHGLINAPLESNSNVSHLIRFVLRALPSNHDTINASLLLVAVIIFVAEHIAVTIKLHGARLLLQLRDIIPVSQLGVSLCTWSAMNLGNRRMTMLAASF